MTEHIMGSERRSVASPWTLTLAIAAGTYLLLLAAGGALLNDPDTYSHIALGRWIIAHGAVPTVDPFSQTFAGTHWVAFEWLSQVAYAVAYAAGGWAAVVALAAAAMALAFALLTRFLLRQIAPVPTLILVLVALVLSSPHILARPHALALPVLVLWVGTLVRALDEGRPPPWLLLPLMILWANLHGSFTLGLLLVGPIAFEAVWNAAPAARRAVLLRWLAFGVLAVAAASINPYGPEMILVTYRTIALGAALSIIGEWQPQDFTHLGPFELILFMAVGYALYTGLRLPWTRILMLLGLMHLALAQSRHGDVLGLLAPLFLAQPLARHLGASLSGELVRVRSGALAIAATAVLMATATGAFLAAQPLAPAARNTPAAAIAATDLANAGPVLNDYGFGGYLDFVGIRPFIDGRTELYGTAFTLRHHYAVTLANLPDFLALLDEYRFGATLLSPGTPAVALLDRLPGWKRVYADDVAVVHRRQDLAPARAAP